MALTFQITMVVRAFGDQLTCRGADSFSGQISGNSLSGTFTPFSTPYLCDGGIPLPISNIPGGNRVFTKA